jgi:hydroxymethylglutaryl-CoA lyase
MKIAVIDGLSAARVPVIEATSFVNPAVLPQMRDAADVLQGIVRRPGTTYLALVPNRRGAEAALAARPDALKFVVSATDAGNLKNVGRTIAQSLDELVGVVRLAASDARPVHLVVGLAFGCPLTGAVSIERVQTIVRSATEAGVSEIAIADSYGFAHPQQVATMMTLLHDTHPDVSFALHLHDTRGLALANAMAGLAVGVTRFESSLGGIGGGPIAPGSMGNAATEDLVNLLHESGVHTGIDLDALVAASRLVQECLGRSLPSRVLASGTSAALFARASAARMELA